MAHELTHVKHRDTLISTISATVAGAISMLAQFGMFFGGRNREGGVNPILGLLVMILAPIAAMLIQLAISRAREFEADRGGAEISNDPEALASALQKMQGYAQQVPNATAEHFQIFLCVCPNFNNLLIFFFLRKKTFTPL